MMRICQYIAALESRVGDLERLINDEILDAKEPIIDVIEAPIEAVEPRRRGRKPKSIESTSAPNAGVIYNAPIDTDITG